jgi:hypothetical protein
MVVNARFTEGRVAGLTFVVPTGLGGPYAVPASDWAAIDARIAMVFEAQAIAAEIERYIPNYPALLSVCSAWRASTFPGLLAQATSTNLFATKAAQTLGQLSSDLTGLQPGDPVPQSVTFIIQVQFKALAQTAGEDSGPASALNQDVQAFVAENQAADKALEQLPLEGWSAIAGPIANLETAMNDVEASWGPIAGQLAAAADGSLEITTAGLLSSNLQQAIQSYQALADAAAAFESKVSQPDSVPTWG